MKKLLFMSLVLSTSVFAQRGVITSEQLSETEINNLKGTYSNIKGFDIIVDIEKPSGQIDLFEPTKYEVSIELDDYRANDRVYLSTGSPRINIKQDGTIIMGLAQDDCDNPGCDNTYTTMTFNKKRSGRYNLAVEVEIEQYIDPGDGYEEDELTDALCRDYLGDIWVRDASYEGYGLCTANAVYYMRKN